MFFKSIALKIKVFKIHQNGCPNLHIFLADVNSKLEKHFLFGILRTIRNLEKENLSWTVKYIQSLRKSYSDFEKWINTLSYGIKHEAIVPELSMFSPLASFVQLLD